MSAPSDARLAALTANIPGAIYRGRLDADWTMAVITDEIERISGYAASDFVDSACRTFASVIHPEDREAVDRAVSKAVGASRPFELEYRIICADGATKWVLERGRLVVEPDGERWLDGIIFDITRRRRAEEQLRRHETEQARVEELRGARARVIEAGDEARRRIERNLHDGAQQRLVGLALTLGRARTKVVDDPDEATRLLDAAIAELGESLTELRELARGIHPAILTDQGLPAALESLAQRASVPVELVQLPSERLPAPVEAAAFYVAAEALANATKYAEASLVAIRVARENGTVVVEIEDDGCGGAEPTRGSGLRGLRDRIEALDGALEVESESGCGTRIRATLPVGP